MPTSSQAMSSEASDLPKLSRPAQRALAAAGIARLEQVAAHSEKEIQQLHGVGPNTIATLHPALAAKGLTFANARHDLVISRVFDAPLALVWRAWTDPDHVMQWWGPDHFTCPSAEIDFREGGAALLCMRAPKEFGGQDFYSTWTYTKIVPMTRIEYNHSLADKDGKPVDPVQVGMPADFPQNQRHVVIFKASGANRTELTVTEYGWPVGHMMELSQMGMEQCLAKMAAIFARAQAEFTP